MSQGPGSGSSGSVATSSAAVTASGMTTMSNVVSALVSAGAGWLVEFQSSRPPSSFARTVTWTRPTWSGASVNVSFPAASIAGATVKRFGTPFRSVSVSKWTVCQDSLGGPGLTAVAHGALYAGLSSPTTTCGGPGVNVGASLTGATQI